MATRRSKNAGQVAEAPVLERVFGASPETLFAYWTTAEGIEAWWGRRGYGAKVEALELRPGGVLRYRLEPADAAWSVNLDRAGMPPFVEVEARFLEICAPEELVYATAVQDQWQGPFVDVVSRITLQAEAGGTRVRLQVDDVGNGPANHQTAALRAEELLRLVALDESPGGLGLPQRTASE